MTSLLEVEDLAVSYGPVAALKGVSLSAQQGEIVAVLGANGAGKTTLLQAISGLLSPRSGTIQLHGKDLRRVPAHTIARLGVTHVPEGRGILTRMTVQDNLRIGAYYRRDGQVEQDLSAVLERFPILAERRHNLAALLSGGQQQMLALARAWMARPRLLLLDEPSLGLAPRLVTQIFEMVSQLREQCAILLVEQNTRAALKLADRAYVLELGRVALQGTAETLMADQQLLHAYLGRRAGARATGGPA